MEACIVVAPEFWPLKSDERETKYVVSACDKELSVDGEERIRQALREFMFLRVLQFEDLRRLDFGTLRADNLMLFLMVGHC